MKQVEIAMKNQKTAVAEFRGVIKELDDEIREMDRVLAKYKNKLGKIDIAGVGKKSRRLARILDGSCVQAA